MLRIIFDNETVWVSYDGGSFEAQPLTNGWLWLIGALEQGEHITIKDDRKTLQPHQHKMDVELNK